MTCSISFDDIPCSYLRKDGKSHILYWGKVYIADEITTKALTQDYKRKVKVLCVENSMTLIKENDKNL